MRIDRHIINEFHSNSQKSPQQCLEGKMLEISWEIRELWLVVNSNVKKSIIKKCEQYQKYQCWSALKLKFPNEFSYVLILGSLSLISMTITICNVHPSPLSKNDNPLSARNWPDHNTIHNQYQSRIARCYKKITLKKNV